MKTKCVILVILLSVLISSAEPPRIVGYDRGGALTFQSGDFGGYFTLEYALSVTGPWTNWASLTDQPITGPVLMAAGPMFFRVKQTSESLFPPRSNLGRVWVSMDQGKREYQNVTWFSLTEPTDSEGVEYLPLRLTATPGSISNKLLVEFNVHINSPDNLGQAAGVFVFKDNDTNSLFGAVREDGYGYGTSGHTEKAGSLTGSYITTVTSLAPAIFRVYVACRNGSTVKLNDGYYGTYGNKLSSTLKVTEIQ